MAINKKEILKKMKEKEKEYFIGTMVINMKEILRKEIDVEKE